MNIFASYPSAFAYPQTYLCRSNEVCAAIEHSLGVQRQLNESLKSKSSSIKEAKQRGRLQERSHYSKVVMKNKAKAETLAKTVTSLTSRTVSADLQLKKAYTQMNRSTKRADDVNDYSESLRLRIIELESTVKQLQEQVVDLEVDLEEKSKKVIELEDSCPIKVFGKVRHGQRGATSWPFYVWELILEQLVNGTPPSSVSANIVIFIQRFSPRVKIKETPSIWTVRRGRTVLLVVVETLAAYRLARAKRWGQMHTDGTG